MIFDAHQCSKLKRSLITAVSSVKCTAYYCCVYPLGSLQFKKRLSLCQRFFHIARRAAVAQTEPFFARRAAVLAQRAPAFSYKAASKVFYTKSPAALRVAKKRAHGMVRVVIIAGSAALITSPARLERNELGHPVPKQIMKAANASFRDATMPSLRGLRKVSNYACIHNKL
jgi:hypothetical protein